jgi:DNA-binding MarR family transcriptional regulator
MPARALPAGLRPGRRVALANRLNTAAIHLLRRIGQDDGAEDVTGARLSALSVLVYGGPRTMGALADRERVAPPTMSRIVDALVRDGLATRMAEPGDRRSVRLEATAAGRRLMERGRSRRIRRLTAELDALAEQEIQALEDAVAVLERLGSDVHRAGARPRSGRRRGKT